MIACGWRWRKKDLERWLGHDEDQQDLFDAVRR
jgi:hypothetical protein